MDESDRVLARNIEQLVSGNRRPVRRGRALEPGRTLQVLVADLVAARAAAGMTQQDVTDRMSTTRSVISRLVSGVRTRPTLTTIEKYARAVGAIVEIRVRTLRWRS
jgi:ribosome-binding protein aMBF1 (putative translation factor)